MKKLFLSDVDGTLLKTREPFLPEVASAAKAFIDAGGYFGLSTGRSPFIIDDITDYVTVNAPCVLCSGALIYDVVNKKPVHAALLDDSIHELMHKVWDKYPEVSITSYSADDMYVVRMNDRLRARGIQKAINRPLVSIEEVISPLKVLFTSDDADLLPAIGKELIDPSLFSYKAASAHFYEITDASVSKGKAVEFIKDVISDDTHDEVQLYTAGDGESDISMGEVADIFFVPETALDTVKAKADIIIPGPRDAGMVKAFEYVMTK